MPFWNNFPAGLGLVSGGDLSEAIRYFDPGTIIHCPTGGPFGTDITQVYPALGMGALDTYAADHIAELAAYDLVQVYTMGGSSGGTVGGWFDCTDFAGANPFRPGFFTNVSLTGGPSDELLSNDDGTVRPVLNPFQSNWTPLTDGVFMRPTALAWDGQDPDNLANRSMWLPSEVIGAIGTVFMAYAMGQAGGQDLYFGTGVRAWNVISGSAHEATDEPVICFV